MSVKHRGFARDAKPSTPVTGQIIYNSSDSRLEEL